MLVFDPKVTWLTLNAHSTANVTACAAKDNINTNRVKFRVRPDVTVIADWALKENWLSI